MSEQESNIQDGSNDKIEPIKTEPEKKEEKEFNADEFIKTVFSDVEKEEQERIAKLQQQSDDKLKNVLKETIKRTNEANNEVMKKLSEQLAQQNKVIEELRGKIDNTSIGSKLPQNPTPNPFNDKKETKNVVDFHTPEFKEKFFKTYGINRF